MQYIKLWLKGISAIAAVLLLLMASDPVYAAVSVTDQDSLQVDVNSNTKVNAGDTVRHTINIQSTGSDAAGMNFSETIDPNTTLVPGSLKTTPVAANHSYTAIGNVRIQVPAGSGLLLNSFGIPAPTAVAATGTSVNSGNYSVSADGSFIYNPPAGFEGTDTFDFTVTNGNGTQTGTVSITVSGMIWFVNNNAGACSSSCDGRLTNPFTTLAALNSVNDGAGFHPAAGDNIFLHASVTAYEGPLTLMNSQKLIGQGATATLQAITGLTPPVHSDTLPSTSGTSPVITTIVAATNGVNLANGNTLRGFDFGNATGIALSGSSFGTLTLSEVAMNTNGAGLGLTTGTANATFSSFTSTGGTNNVSLTSVTGTVLFGGGSMTGATGAAFAVSGGTVSTTYSGSISQANNAAMVSVSGGHITGTLTFDTGTLNATNGTGLQFDNADGTYNFNGTNTLNGGDSGIDIINGSAGSFTFSSNTTITNPSGIAFNVNGGSGTIAYNGTISKTSAGRIADIQSRTGGSVTLTGALTCNTSCSGINASVNSGGTIAFSGTAKTLSTAANPAVNLSGNTGATINFTNGGLAVTTTSGAGFSATGGGTVTVTGTVNTLTSTTGTALNVQNTTIGASGLTFRSISANGAANGIVLSTTGSGGLTVTGTGTTDGTGGTIQNISGRGASFVSANNITLKNMNFTNTATAAGAPCGSAALAPPANDGCNAAMHFKTVNTVTLDNLNITSSGQQGINAVDLIGLSLSNSVLSGLGNAADEDGLHFHNLLGTNSITSTNITGSGDDNVNIQNLSATPSTINITGGSFNTGVLGSGLLFGVRNTANTTINISGVTSDNNFSGGIVADNFDAATMDIEVLNSTITNNNDAISVSSNNGSAKFDIHNNISFAGTDFGVINILKAAFSTSGTLEGKIRDNPSITVANGRAADALSVFNAGAGALTIAITNNTIDYAGTQRAILIQGGQDGSGSIDATVTGNSINIQLDGAGNALTGILAQTAITGPGNTTSLCADFGGAGVLRNLFTHSLGNDMGGGDIRLRQRNDGTVRMPAYGGAAADTAAVVTYLTARNTLVNSPTATATVQSSGFGGGGACIQPSIP